MCWSAALTTTTNQSRVPKNWAWSCRMHLLMFKSSPPAHKLLCRRHTKLHQANQPRRSYSSSKSESPQRFSRWIVSPTLLLRRFLDRIDKEESSSTGTTLNPYIYKPIPIAPRVTLLRQTSAAYSSSAAASCRLLTWRQRKRQTK